MSVATGPGPRLGFVGLGRMGGAMAAHLQETGCALAIHDRAPDTGSALVEAGAHWHDSPAGVAGEASQVLLSLGQLNQMMCAQRWLQSSLAGQVRRLSFLCREGA